MVDMKLAWASKLGGWTNNLYLAPDWSAIRTDLVPSVWHMIRPREKPVKYVAAGLLGTA